MAPPRSTKTPVKRTTKPRASKKKRKTASTWWRWPAVIFVLILLSPLYYGYILNFFSATWRWMRDIGEDPHYRTYKSYKIRIPSGYQIHGIDVSYAQGKIDWHRVKAMEEDSVKVGFAFIKATEGLMLVDSYFKRNWREAPKAGITCGAYHFFRPKKSGLWQARFFLQNVTIERGDLPAVCDIEVLDGTSPAAMRKELKEFLRFVENKTGVKPIIYTSISYYRDYLQGYFDGYPLWIAHYYQPKLKLGGSTAWHFWQHSDKARVNGINHVVDFNVFKGDSLSFQKLLVR
ncbi:glycoside hydrolase family 25 protein [Mucilaginibacter pedocola]|uniref:Glycoside hydrolase n=1 Tax=Mucilaginibacter pedocola TaxID=1792845 RepID=A0A1S9PGB9_9SPHI|nr:glycoside hydrolase family 25 protein [Mucilaginibacter pedocola]OOQ59588.1 glycoside hydrolase [Mucilaginibacter pedocola]